MVFQLRCDSKTFLFGAQRSFTRNQFDILNLHLKGLFPTINLSKTTPMAQIFVVLFPTIPLIITSPTTITFFFNAHLSFILNVAALYGKT